MKAIVSTEYGSPDVLKLEEVDRPALEPDRVLVRVRAASVNAVDWRMLRGQPYAARPMMGGLRRPKSSMRGGDVAGTVEAVGENVTEFQPGDEVFGAARGTFASTRREPHRASRRSLRRSLSRRPLRSRWPASPRCRLSATTAGSRQGRAC